MVRIKRSVLIGIISLFCLSGLAYADTDISTGIEAYQSGNYNQCIETMRNIVKDDPTSAVSYYYLGLAYIKTGQDILAIQNFNKVINLNSDATLTKLARQGKASVNGSAKIETQLRDITEDIKEKVEEEYNPILEDASTGTKSVNSQEPVDKTPPQVKMDAGTSKVIKASDYAKANPQAVHNPNAQPTNDDIVNAIRTLQKAGLLQNGAAGLVNGQTMPMQMPMDSRTQQMNSMLMMMNNGNGNNMMNMMPYMNNGGNVDPQLMQMMLMNQMMPNFSGGNNNGGGY